MMMIRIRKANFIYKTEISTEVMIELINEIMGKEIFFNFCFFSSLNQNIYFMLSHVF